MTGEIKDRLRSGYDGRKFIYLTNTISISGYYDEGRFILPNYTTTVVNYPGCYATTTTGNANEQWCVPIGTYILCTDTIEPNGCTWMKTWLGCSFSSGPVQHSATEYGPRRKLVTLL